MARPNVDSKLAEFRSLVDDSLLLANDATHFQEVRSGRFRTIQQPRIWKIHEMAFLGMFLAWEDFLEASFIRFMCGAITRNRYKPRLYVAPTNMDHALKFFVVKPREYVEWASSQQVIERAEMVFRDGEPYKSAIRPSITDLDHMKQIRNAIAHRSGTAWDKFESTARRLLGSRPRGLTPGMFLTKTHTASGRPYIEYYGDVLSVVASRIVR